MAKSGDMCDVNHDTASCDGPSMASQDMARPPVMASHVLMLHKHMHRGTSTMHSMAKHPQMIPKTLHPPLMWLMGWMAKFLPALDFVGRRQTTVRP